MTKAAGRLTFALKAAQPFSVAAHFRRQQLNGDAIAEQNVPRAIDRAHSTFAQQSFDLVLAVELLADQRRRIFFQYLAIGGAEAQSVVIFSVAGRAVLHGGTSLLNRTCPSQ